MADQAYKQYFNGEVSANNYGNGNPNTTTDDKGITDDKQVQEQKPEGENAPTYDNGGMAKALIHLKTIKTQKVATNHPLHQKVLENLVAVQVPAVAVQQQNKITNK